MSSHPAVPDAAAPGLRFSGPEPAETHAHPPLSPTLCHRCEADLPFRVGAGESGAIFCPHCGAPQLLLPAHLLPDPARAGATTGVAAPPRMGLIAWPQALPIAVAAALLQGVVLAFSMAVPALSLLVLFLLCAAPALVLTAYRRRAPDALITGRVGLRVGFASGVLTLFAMGLGLATAGLIARFGLHHMDGFDSALSASLANAQAQSHAMMAGSPDAPQVEASMHALMSSPEGRAGMALFTVGFQSVCILLLSGFSGALAGAAGHRARTRGTLV